MRRCLKMAAEEPQQQKQEPLGSDAEGTASGRTVRPGPGARCGAAGSRGGGGRGGRRPGRSARTAPFSAVAAASPPPHNRRSRRCDPRPGGRGGPGPRPFPSRAPGRGLGRPAPAPSPRAGLRVPCPAAGSLQSGRGLGRPRRSPASSRAAGAREASRYPGLRAQRAGGRRGCCGRGCERRACAPRTAPAFPVETLFRPGCLSAGLAIVFLDL